MLRLPGILSGGIAATPEEAAETARKLVAAFPSAEAHVLRASVFLELDQLDGALNSARAAIAAAPGYVGAHVQLVEVVLRVLEVHSKAWEKTQAPPVSTLDEAESVHLEAQWQAARASLNPDHYYAVIVEEAKTALLAVEKIDEGHPMLKDVKVRASRLLLPHLKIATATCNSNAQSHGFPFMFA